MAILADQFPPVDVSGYGRSVADQIDTTVLQSVFPNQTQTSNVATWRVNDRARNEAKYRSWGSETEFGRRPGGREVSQKLAPLGLKLPYLEDDALAVANGLADEQDIVDRLADQVTEAVVNTLQKQRAGALENAGYLAEGENFSVPIQFDRAADHDVTAPNLWSATSADPIEFIDQQADKVRRDSGIRPNIAIMSKRVFSALARNAAMISYAGAAAKTNLIAADLVNSTFTGFGLPTIVIFDEEDVNGQPLLSDNKVFLASDTGIGRTSWGPSTASLNPKYGFARIDAPGLFVGVYEEEDADTKYVRSDATALAVLQIPDATLAAAVLDPA